MMPGGMGGYGIFGLLFWIFLIAIAVYLVLYLLRGGSERSSEGRSASQSALDILEERYARGEIDKQEFEEKKRDLIR
jgi:putative membrane protein